MCYKHNGDDLNKWTYVQCDDGCISNCSDNVYELWKLKKFVFNKKFLVWCTLSECITIHDVVKYIFNIPADK